MDLVRYLQEQVEKDLKKKMVFLGGPRQVGKTTLALQVGSEKSYLNWDDGEDRQRILERSLPSTKLWIFDEIHKYKAWRNYLKGIYDKNKSTHQILVTGSARLDLYRRGGDSLQGRYHFLRLHPLSLEELKQKSHSSLMDLFHLGGFPEPFLQGEKFESDRWSREYRQRLIRDDISSIEHIEDLGNLELLMLRLPDLVGSPLSINSIREDLQVSHKTVSRWLDIYEKFYAIFRLSPFGGKSIKALKKEQKHYHYDWNLVKDEGARFENLLASHFLKWCHFLEDTRGRDIELRFYRDLEQREVDFVITENQKPIIFIEAKLSEGPVSKHLIYLKRKFPGVQAWQIHLKGKKDYANAEGIRVAPAHTALIDIYSLLV